MFRTRPDDLTSAGARVRDAADALREVDVASPFSQASEAVPGSQVSQSCLWVSTRLGAAVQVWAEDLESLGDAARATATDALGTDEAVAETLRRGTPR